MKFEELNLKALQELETHVPKLAGFPSRLLADTYDKFIEVLYRDIDNAIFNIQKNAELRQNDTEDRLTIDIINQLNCVGYSASHDKKICGHADLVVEYQSFIWIGEAKIHKDYNYIWEGFQQLATRYSIGDFNQKDGGILIYIRNADAQSVMDKWRDFLGNKDLPDYFFEICSSKASSFFSTHKHEKSGQLFRIRHMPVILHFSPKDKSGRNTRSKKSE